MKDYLCNITTVDELSILCTNGSDTSSMECVTITDPTHLVMRYILATWFLLIFIFGTFGNLATLLSIPFAAKRRLHGLDRNFKNTTIFIVHLSLIDLIHCLLFTLPNCYALFTQHWPFGTICCRITGVAWQITIILEVMGLNIISISRCLDLNKKQLWNTCTQKRIKVFLVLVLVWLPGVLSLIPSVKGSDAGWDCRVGQCANWYYSVSDTLYFLIINIISMLTIIICYLLIWRKAHQSTVSITTLGNINIDLQNRESKLTKMILLLVFVSGMCNLILVVFIGSLAISSLSAEITIYFVTVSVYESQFALNFFIYALKNDDYRKAYRDYWRYLIRRDEGNRNVSVPKDTIRFHNSILPSRLRLIAQKFKREAAYDVRE